MPEELWLLRFGGGVILLDYIINFTVFHCLYKFYCYINFYRRNRGCQKSRSRVSRQNQIQPRNPEVASLRAQRVSRLSFIAVGSRKSSCSHRLKHLFYPFSVTSAVRISLPSIFCILNNLLIQVYKRSSVLPRSVERKDCATSKTIVYV